MNEYESDRKSLRRLAAAAKAANKSSTRSHTPKTATATNNKPSAANNKPTMTSNKRKSKNITNDSLAVVPNDGATKAQRTDRRPGLRPHNKLHAPQQHHKSADDYSIRKALGGGGAVGRGGEKKKSGGVKKSGNKGKITLPYLIQNLDSMPQKGPQGLLQANKDLGVGQRCLMSKKSNNGSGFKACGCVGGKACNVKNLKDAIAFWNLPENERALLGPPGSAGTYNPKCTDLAAHMRGMAANCELGGVVGDRLKVNAEAGSLYLRTLNADVRDSNNNPLMSVVDATDTSVGKIILAMTQDGYDEDGKPYPNAALEVIRNLDMDMDESDLGSRANVNSKAIHYLEKSFKMFGLESHPNNVNGYEGRGLGWEHLERVYTHPKLTKNVRKNQVNVEGVSQLEALKLRKAAKKAEEEEEVP